MRGRKVMVLGDHPDASGGISQVMKIVQTRAKDVKGLRVSFVNSNFKGLLGFFKVLTATISWMVRARKPDVVHINTASKGSTYRNIILAFFIRAFGRRYLVHLHGGAYREFYAAQTGWIKSLIRDYFRSASTVITLTDAWKEFVAQDLRVAKEKIAVVPNGTDYALTNVSKTREPTIIFAGRVTRRKGVFELIEACRLISAETPVKLVIAGNVEDADLLELIRGMSWIEALGTVPNDMLKQQIASSWVFALPSHAENLPMTIIEAMSVRTAVVGSRVGGIPELISDGVTGLLVDRGDSTQLAAALARLLASQSVREELSERAFVKWRENYTAERMTKLLFDNWCRE